MSVARTPRLVWLVAVLALLVPAGAQAAGPRGEKYALLVGVRQYNGGGLRNLHWTEDDMVGLAKVLGENGYRPENIILMTQSTARTRGERFLPQAARVRK